MNTNFSWDGIFYEKFIYFELRMKDQIEERSSQLVRNPSSCENNFFQAFFSQLLKLRANCEDLSSIWFHKTVKKITLRSAFTGKQGSDHIRNPSSPDSMLFSGSWTVSWQLALPKPTHRAEWLLFSRHLLTVQEKFKMSYFALLFINDQAEPTSLVSKTHTVPH